MDIIEIREVHWEPLSLYQKVNVQSFSQRALLGYMNRNGYLRDPIYGGAFALLREFESYVGIPLVIQRETDDEVAIEIYEIANNAKLGRYDRYVLPQNFIRETRVELESERKGGKGK